MILILLISFSSVVFAGSSYPGNVSLQFNWLTRENGLAHNNVEAILQDSDGFIWFGTRNGLCRYDGYEFRTYQSSGNPGSVSGNRIMSLCEDRNGSIWVGTYNTGLNRFDKQTETFYRYGPESGLGNTVYRIVTLKDGTLFACTNYGLAVYEAEKDSFAVYFHDESDPYSLRSSVVYDLHETQKGEIYVATESADIQIFNRVESRFYPLAYKRDPALNNNYRKRIIEDRNGMLYIAAYMHGFCRLDPSTGKSVLYTQQPGQLSTNVLMGDMALAPDGRIWISTDGNGVIIYDPENEDFSFLSNKPGEAPVLSSDHIYTIYFDREERVWIGTFNKGINFFDPRQYKFHIPDREFPFWNALHNKSVLALFEDSKGRIWAGTDGNGLYMWDKGKVTRYTANPGRLNSLSSDVITSLAEDDRGHILIGTYAGGFLSLDPETGKFTHYSQSRPNEINSTNVWAILKDSRQRIWLGLLGNGVDLYDPVAKTFTNFGPQSARTERINFENVMAIMEDSEGDIWFGSEGRGIYILDNQTGRIRRIAPVGNSDVTTNGIIKSLFQDHWGVYWIGTEGSGLYRYDRVSGDIRQFTRADGLPGNIIQSIFEDQQGYLWMGTSDGISMYDMNTGTFVNFLREDGLSGNEFNPNACRRLSDGRIIIGTTSGVDIFDPAAIHLNGIVPKVCFTKLKIYNEEVLPGAEINGKVILHESILRQKSVTLTHREQSFSVEFAALNLTLPRKCQYRYMLEGFDPFWISTSSEQRVASYSNLDPGEYRLRVRASNNDGRWGENEADLVITILPPLYETLAFKIFLVCVIILGIMLFFRYRLNLHKERFRQQQAEQDKRIVELENEKLEAELQKLAFHVINRNRLLAEQKNRLLGLSLKARESVKEGISKIIEKIDEDLDDEKDWKYIEPQLDKLYDNFITRLREKHPDLTLSEIKIAAYVRMNLGSKEISEFMHKTIRAVENDRYRLRKKLGLDSNDSLQHYLSNL
ncbi:MAG: ligand-binding sensor domain-containing protein [Bacteroidota bacterium]